MAMLAVFALVAGGIYLIRQRRDRRKGVLMIACALVILGNILIWTMPAHAAATRPAGADGPDRLQQAAIAVDSGDCKKAMSLAGPALKAAAAADAGDRSAPLAYTVAAFCALRSGDQAAAYRAALAGTRFDKAPNMLWTLRLELEIFASRHAEAVTTVEAMRDGRGGALNAMPIRSMYRLTGDLDKAKAVALQRRLLRVLTDNAYDPDEAVAPLDGFRQSYAAILLADGDTAGATAQIRQIEEPSVAIELWADPRFRPLLPPDFDIRAVTERALAAAMATREQNGNLLEPINRAGRHLRVLGRLQASLEVLETARANGRELASFSDADTYANWWWDEMARTYAALNRPDDAIAALRAGGAISEMGSINVSQLINLAGLQSAFDRPADALVTLAPFATAKRPVSPYGEAEMRFQRGCASALTGDLKAMASDRDYLESHRADHPRALLGLLLCIGDLDAAAGVVIAQLDDPDQRVAMRLFLADYDAPVVALPPDPIDRQLPALKARADVQAAITRAGGALRVPLQSQPM
ncbi:hypothetical protein [Sphingomonas sp.]|uniref:hypothetical protein n=1 Tax=Sphingomonas sp. TaxID=28214 RepID=UPI002D80E679|nr:hypothetical protein [Sphingomonas sp.]